GGRIAIEHLAGRPCRWRGNAQLGTGKGRSGYRPGCGFGAAPGEEKNKTTNQRPKTRGKKTIDDRSCDVWIARFLALEIWFLVVHDVGCNNPRKTPTIRTTIRAILVSLSPCCCRHPSG